MNFHSILHIASNADTVVSLKGINIGIKAYFACSEVYAVEHR